MFYSTFILQRKGPFAKVWMAAHWDKKLTKSDIKLVDISETVVNIVRPTVPMALRTSGELMLGVVKIYTHKVKFLLKEAQDATMRMKALDVIPLAGKIDMPIAKGAAALMEPERAARADVTLPIYEPLFVPLDRSLIEGGPPQIGVHLGDLDDWFQVPAERELTFEESQQYAFFPFLRRLGEPTPSEVSSIERLRRRVTPERRGEPDITVGVPVDELELFAKFEQPTPMEEAPLPGPLEMITPAGVGEEVHVAELPERAERPKKKVPVVIDKTTLISADVIRARLENTSDIVRLDGEGAVDRRGLEMRAWEVAPLADRFAAPMCCAELTSAISDVWNHCVRRPELEAEAEAERLRREEGRPSYAPGEGAPEAGMGIGLEPFVAPGEEVPGPQIEMELPPSPAAERKRKARDEAEARKRAKLGIDLTKTVHDTLAQFAGQFRTRNTIKFGVLVRGQTRTVVATKFYDVLVLKNKNLIDVKQPTPLGEITITPTEYFQPEALAV